MIRLSKKLKNSVGKSNAKYQMFEQGDKILLAVSGGKDSLVLAHLMKHFKAASPLDWDFKALSIAYGMGEDFSEVESHFKAHDIPYEVLQTQIYKLGKEKIRANTTFCSFCSRLRRGHLYTYALEHGFNKIAIGHHFDDAVESFFMNMTYNGALRTLAPKYKAYNDIVIIRPLILTRESQIIGCANDNILPILNQEDSCPAKKESLKSPHARDKVSEFAKNLESLNPKFYDSLKAAFENIHKDTFFNTEYLNL